jgi:ABC-2 type transport system permease protein
LDLLKGFGNFLLKELKELIRDPKIIVGMIVVPLILFPILGAVMNFSVESAKETATKTTALVLNHDSGENSTQFIAYLGDWLRVFKANVSTVDEAVQQMASYNATELIEIPQDFSQNVSVNRAVEVKFYSIYSGAGLLEGIGSSIVDSVVVQFNRNVAPDLIVAEKSSIIKGKAVENVDPRALSGLMISQAVALPVTMMIMLTYSMQIAATSVAMEKEEKTLETVLTLPMDRFAILMGKLSGSIIIAGAAAVAYMVGFNYYMGSFSGLSAGGANLDLVSLGLVPSAFGYLLLGISLFITLLSALALAVILSAFAEDVRSAQSLVSYVYPLVFIPSLILMYVDINMLPVWLRWVLYAIPFSQPIIASKAVIMGDYLTAGLGIVYVVGFTLVIMYAASRLFATEKILTAKLKLRGLRKGGRKSTEET